ncbi:type VII secretion protein EccB [Pseudonocardia sp.]|uniref:type VII secretion protein EccB n=1 Tax=Pseudonocardia sp. TaxID=60912 RepID=UPI0026295BFE|nr:type VII secretion protein EccB [Pseudonocardia sp.]
MRSTDPIAEPDPRPAARAPATRDQADAYRFGLRRMESALVRGDPVPLHEQVRTQRRAAVAGTLLGMLALGAVAIYGLIVPKPDWSRQAVVVGAGSGAMYVVAHGPDRLVPVANLPAARLVLSALRAGGATGAEPGTAQPVVVDDADLDGAPRTATAAVPGATAVRLDGTVIAPHWAVCDEPGPDGGDPRTTVIGGAALPGTPPSADAVLVTVGGGGTWLVTGRHRHRVEDGDRALLAALGLGGRDARPASAALVNAVPEGPPLRAPRIPGAGADGPSGVPGRVGDVLVGRPPGAGPPVHFVVLPDGVQQVPEVYAQTLRAAGGGMREVGPEVLGAASLVDGVDVSGWPEQVPRVVEGPGALCWTWSADGDPGGGILVGDALPVPVGAVPVDLVQADGTGERADAVVLAPAGGGAVRATGPGRAAGAGPLWLVAATGVAYGVADEPTAAALGVTAAEPAPEAALRLLPVGGSLDLGRAALAVDVPPG